MMRAVLAGFALLAACAPAAEDAAPAHESVLEIVSIADGARRVVHSGAEIGAPNWGRDELYFNAGGQLYAISAAGGEPRLIALEGAQAITHDHGPSPDGALIAFTDYGAERQAHIFVASSAGGPARQVTTHAPSYFHAWAPGGARLAFTARRGEEDNYDVYTIALDGSDERRLTDAPGTDDGADFAPDGTIFFNSARSGAMRIWRMAADGSGQAQVTFDEAYQDWFPHPSPDGRWLAFLSYPAAVEGLAYDQPVAIRIMPLDGSAPPRVLAEFTGGQGSFNVPPWAPDSRALAFAGRRAGP